MKDLKAFINEALILEAYDATQICKKIQSIKGFSTKIKASDKPKEVYILKFNKTTGEFIDSSIGKNNDTYTNGNNDYADYCIWIDDQKIIPYLWAICPEFNDCSLSVDIIDNTKKAGIIIGCYEESNIEIIKQFVKDNLKLFDKSSEGLSKDEIEQLDKFFSENVKNYEKKLDKKTFAAYFPSRKEAGEKLGRMGYANIPHVTIARPNSYKGNLKVTSYRSGNWAPTEWPDLRKMMNDNGTPKYTNIDSIIPYLTDIVLKKNGGRLGIELK